jgi:hypothetical protein
MLNLFGIAFIHMTDLTVPVLLIINEEMLDNLNVLFWILGDI